MYVLRGRSIRICRIGTILPVHRWLLLWSYPSAQLPHTRSYQGNCTHNVRYSSIDLPNLLGIEHRCRYGEPDHRLGYQQKFADGRLFSSTRRRNQWRHSEALVAIGGSGSVKLDLYEEFHDADLATQRKSNSSEPQRSTAARNVIVYLPPGPSQDSHCDQIQDFQQFLEAIKKRRQAEPDQLASLSVVRINYRLAPLYGSYETSDDHRFPRAVHDVTIGFDWIMRHFSRDDSHDVRVIIYGRNIGGSLGLMLALTSPNEIHSLAVFDPVTDWVGLDELSRLSQRAIDEEKTQEVGQIVSDSSKVTSSEGKKRRSKGKRDKEKPSTRLSEQLLAADMLIKLRTSLFRTPSGFFDPFASPLLFLRAPGRDTPLWKTSRPEHDLAIAKTEGTSFGPYDDDWHSVEANTSEEDFSISQDGQNQDMIAEALGADGLSQPQVASMDDIVVPRSMLGQQDGNLAITDPLSPLMTTGPATAQSCDSDPKLEVKLVKRRKVLRRWPSVNQPEDVILPYTKIFSTLPAGQDLSQAEADLTIDLAAVLNPQAREMTEIMRRACFWGRDATLAQERVMLEEIPPSQRQTGRDATKVVQWIFKKMTEDT